MEFQGMVYRGIIVPTLLLCMLLPTPLRADEPSPIRTTEVQESFVVRDGAVVLQLNEDAIRGTGYQVTSDARGRGVGQRLSFTVNTSAAMYEIIVTNRQLAALIGGDLPAVGPTFRFDNKAGSAVVVDMLYIVHDPSGASDAEFTVFDGADYGLHLFDLSGATVEFDDARDRLLLQGDVRIATELADHLGDAQFAGLNIGELTATLAMQLSQTIVLDQDNFIESATMYPIVEPGTEAPFPSPGPDVIVGDLPATQQFGRVGPVGSGTVGLAVGTTSCNKGDTPFNWFALPNPDHPMIPMNLYRLMTVNGAERFEQIGQSWMKHGFTALQQNICGFGCTPTSGTHLGVGCSDPYSVGLNASQCGLGARAQLNPYTGVIPGGSNLGGSPCSSSNYPSRNHTGHTHDGISHRLQVQDVDLAIPAARYFSEGHYLTPHEFNDPNAFANQNMNNNASHREVSVTGPTGSGTFTFTNVGATVRESPAIDAWTGATQVLVEPAPMVDGRAFLSYKVTALAGGSWHYEYAVYNMNMDRSIESFSIPVHSSVTVTNVGFHFPLNHNDAGVDPAEQYANTNWTFTRSGVAVTWSTDSFATNPNANAIRFGTLYNFRFDADGAPQSADATLGLFKTATTTLATVQGPMAVGPPPVCGNGIVEPGEQCDDGNTIPGDGCDQNCQIETTCGNGIVEFGEQCDDGNTINTDACLNTCLNATCGDGIVWAGVEECDTAGQSATCDADCTFAVCGDGTLNALAGEQCDDGNTIPGDGCDATCQKESNDLCVDAIPIAEGTTAFDTTAAQTDGQAHAVCEFDGQTYNDIWYDYTASCSGNLTVSLCGSGYDTDLVVYNGCVCPLTDVELLACSDDNCPGGPPASYRSELPSSAFPSLPVVAGNCYKIRVGGWNSGDSGTGTITITNSGSPCFIDCNNNGVSDAKDISVGTSLDVNVNGIPDECEAAGNPIVGAKLYDKWWLQLGLTAPITDHPLWQFRPDQTSNASTGAATWRCKECHGWDYKGVAGVYGSGMHRTGFPGVLGTTLTETQIFTLLKQPPNNGGGAGVLNGHDFGSVMTDAQINDGVAFALLGLIDEVAYIDALASFIGSEPQGLTNYTTGGSTACINCHGADGTTINFGTPQTPEWVGTVAVRNPWEFMHKARFGHPAAAMPSWIQDGGDNQGVADIGKYAQLTFPVDCIGTGACDDGDPCTSNDTCVNGTCVGGTSTNCDDGNACTTDTCNALSGCVNTLITCDDANVCTTDTCSAATGCVFTSVDCNDANACTSDSCDTVTGCVNTPLSCDDGNACTTDSCDSLTGCANVPMSCDDGNICTTDTCDTVTGCSNATLNCDDANACTVDSCDALTGCVNAPITCDDTNACTNDTCDAVTGCVFTPITCDDTNACTNDTCDTVSGCVFTPVTCDDADACTTDSCNVASGCVFSPVDCNDMNACTADSCDTMSGCVNASITCNDSDACTTDTCDPASGCVNVAVDCNDGDACTSDSCDTLSGCAHVAVDCDDGNLCTVDVCDIALGCTNTPVSCPPGNTCDPADGLCKVCVTDADCDDGAFCNGVEMCIGGTSCAAGPDPCDDGIACTSDQCNEATDSCIPVPLDFLCDNGVFCDGAETCDVNLGCQSGTTVDCDDGNLCTDDSCDNGTSQCVHTDISATCDDGNPCTDDGCDPLAGCIATNNTAPCDDGDECTSGDTCINGVCMGTPLVCDDGNPCTTDSCNPVVGCQTECAPFGGACDAGGGPGSGVCDGACVCVAAGSNCPNGTAADCCDLDFDSVRDDSCVWCACDAGTCANRGVIYADVGGASGGCVPDGFCNLADALQVLTCFSDTNSCEDMNVDVGGAFGDCAPDGFCNLADALHTLTCFAGSNSCTCGAPPAPEFMPLTVDVTTLALVADHRVARPGDTIAVRIFADTAMENLQSYQLHVAAGGGRRGYLELLEVSVERRRDFVFAGSDDVFMASNAVKSQMLAGHYAGNVATIANGYLATFTYRVSADAEGVFVIDVLHDDSAGDQTYIVASFVNKIEVLATSPAVIVVSDAVPSPGR